MTKLQSLRITVAVDKIVEGLNMLKNAVEALVPAEKPESLCDKFPAEFEAARPKARPVQPDLPSVDFKLKALGEASHRATLGDFGFADEANPVRQEIGQAGGLATAGVARAPSPDRRARGTVMVKLMAVNEKRRYWRWAKDRAKCRKAGLKPPAWAEWVGKRG